MVRYLVVHNKHEGCYDYKCYEDPEAQIRLTSITINPPKIFMFDTREAAQDFFEEYMSDIDVLDKRCKKDDDIKHLDYCTCGITELDEEGNPILFYNKRNQLFLLEHGPEVFLPPHELKEDIKNFNLTTKLLRKSKTLSVEQRMRYIELGKYCEQCNFDENGQPPSRELLEELEKKFEEDLAIAPIRKREPEPAKVPEEPEEKKKKTTKTVKKEEPQPQEPVEQKKKKIIKKTKTPSE